MAAQAEKKRIVVTGGNKGIGFALCKELAINRNCHVYLGSRSKERGEAAVKKILDEDENASVELLIVDVMSDESVDAAAKSLDGVKLYGLVGLGQEAFDANEVIAVNVYGAKRVADKFWHLLDLEAEGKPRFANTGSGAGPSYLQGTFNGNKVGALSVEERKVLASPKVTWNQIEALIAKEKELNYGGATMDDGGSRFGAYMLSKACLTAYVFGVAAANPGIICTSCTPGYVATDMTSSFPGNKLTPLQGCKSLLHCLLSDEAKTSTFYGSDALRSPVHKGRDPGSEEYTEPYE